MSRAERINALPLSLAPRGLSREETAAYIGVSPAKLDEMVADMRMPRPRKVDARRLWDRHELDAAFSALPHEGGEPTPESADDPWGDVAL